MLPWKSLYLGKQRVKIMLLLGLVDCSVWVWFEYQSSVRMITSWLSSVRKIVSQLSSVWDRFKREYVGRVLFDLVWKIGKSDEFGSSSVVWFEFGWNDPKSAEFGLRTIRFRYIGFILVRDHFRISRFGSRAVWLVEYCEWVWFKFVLTISFEVCPPLVAIILYPLYILIMLHGIKA